VQQISSNKEKDSLSAVVATTAQARAATASILVRPNMLTVVMMGMLGMW
jgi:hypothetical protein